MTVANRAAIPAMGAVSIRHFARKLRVVYAMVAKLMF